MQLESRVAEVPTSALRCTHMYVCACVFVYVYVYTLCLNIYPRAHIGICISLAPFLPFYLALPAHPENERSVLSARCSDRCRLIIGISIISYPQLG